MQKYKKLALSLTVLSLVLAFGAGSQAYAFRDSSNVKAEDTQSTETENSSEDSHADHPELRKKAAADLAAMRAKHQDVKTKSSAERQKKCENHKHGLNTKFSKISTNSQKIQDRIDNIFTKAKAYQQAKNLQPENYDNLVAAATSAQAASQASITTLKSLTPTIDCTGTNTAADVAAYKAAATDTRDKLKAYRSAVKDVLKALQIAKKPVNAEGSN
ncbi:MAG: hypothetical protein AAB436_03090 [Patescibacteria group bacterium]